MKTETQRDRETNRQRQQRGREISYAYAADTDDMIWYDMIWYDMKWYDMIWSWWWWWCWRRCCDQEFASWWGLAPILDVHPSSPVRFRGEVRWGMESYLSGDDVGWCGVCVGFWVVALLVLMPISSGVCLSACLSVCLMMESVQFGLVKWGEVVGSEC